MPPAVVQFAVSIHTTEYYKKHNTVPPGILKVGELTRHLSIQGAEALDPQLSTDVLLTRVASKGAIAVVKLECPDVLEPGIPQQVGQAVRDVDVHAKGGGGPLLHLGLPLEMGPRVRGRCGARDELDLDEVQRAPRPQECGVVAHGRGPVGRLEAPDQQPLVHHVEGAVPPPRGGERRRDVVLAQVDTGGPLRRGGGEQRRADVDAEELELALGELLAEAAEPCPYPFVLARKDDTVE